MKNTQSSISRVSGIVAFVLICVVVIWVFDRPVHAQIGADEFRRGEVLVEIKPGASIDEVNARFGTTTLQRIYGTNFYRLRTPNGKKENKFRKRLSGDVDVLSA